MTGITTTVTSDRGIPFNVRIVSVGERYGSGLCLTHDEPEPMVEFYDARYADRSGFIAQNGGNHWGQFVSRYYFRTLQERPSGTGLMLDGGIPAWSLDAAAMDAAMQAVIGALACDETPYEGEDERGPDYDPSCGGCVAGTNPYHRHAAPARS